MHWVSRCLGESGCRLSRSVPITPLEGTFPCLLADAWTAGPSASCLSESQVAKGLS